MASRLYARSDRILICMGVLLFLGSILPAVQADDLVVPDDYPDIRTAYGAAVDGDTIIIKPGRYRGAANREIVVLGKTIAIRGTDPQNPGIIGRTVIDCEGQGFAFRFLQQNQSELAGLTITNGYVANGAGAAIRIEDSSPTIRRCVIRANHSTGSGGAVFCTSWNADTPSEPRFIQCEFSRNSASGDGGAFSIVDNSSPVFEECVFEANQAGGRGGAVYLYGSSSVPTSVPEFLRCSFIDNVSNSTSRGGAAICVELNVNATIIDGQFTGNVATADGGAIYAMQGNMQVARSVFEHNSAQRGGAIALERVSDSEIIDSMIADNDAADCAAGVLAGEGATVMLRHNTIANNTASDSGGAVCAWTGSNLTVSHSILWHNQPDQIDDSQTTPTVRWSNVQNGYAGEGNMNADPMFIDPAAGDYRLDHFSPCFDAGDPAFQPAPGERDIEGDPRLLFERVDIGADEKSHRNSHELAQLNPVPGTAGEMNTLAVTDAMPGETIFFCYALRDGSARLPDCGTQILELKGAKVIGKAVADGSGHASIEIMVPAAAKGRMVHFQAVELSSCSVSNSIAFMFD